jgi:hypothetical protein
MVPCPAPAKQKVDACGIEPVRFAENTILIKKNKLKNTDYKTNESDFFFLSLVS